MNDEEIIESILDGLTHIVVAKGQNPAQAWGTVSANYFDGFEVFDPRLSWDPEDDFILASNPIDAPIWPYDICFGYWRHEDGAPGWSFRRLRTANKIKWRGRLKTVYPRMIEHANFHVYSNGETWGSLAVLGLKEKSVVRCSLPEASKVGLLYKHQSFYGADKKDDKRGEFHEACIAHGLALWRQYKWSVLIGEPGLPRARFSTDPVGIREIFRLRDIPEGAKRRAALRHWVREHWRKKKRDSAADRAWIRSHLRGAENFDWSGFRCRIEPSIEDIAKNEAKK